jgi:hypothetical protein
MAYDEALIAEVWKRARATMDQDPNEWRKDECGAWMYREHYGSPASEFGWWIADVSLGKEGGPENLRAFHKGNSFDVSNGAPRCTVTADRDGIGPEQSVLKPHNRSV